MPVVRRLAALALALAALLVPARAWAQHNLVNLTEASDPTRYRRLWGFEAGPVAGTFGNMFYVHTGLDVFLTASPDGGAMVFVSPHSPMELHNIRNEMRMGNGNATSWIFGAHGSARQIVGAADTFGSTEALEMRVAEAFVRSGRPVCFLAVCYSGVGSDAETRAEEGLGMEEASVAERIARQSGRFVVGAMGKVRFEVVGEGKVLLVEMRDYFDRLTDIDNQFRQYGPDGQWERVGPARYFPNFDVVIQLGEGEARVYRGGVLERTVPIESWVDVPNPETGGPSGNRAPATMEDIVRRYFPEYAAELNGTAMGEGERAQPPERGLTGESLFMSAMLARGMIRSPVSTSLFIGAFEGAGFLLKWGARSALRAGHLMTGYTLGWLGTRLLPAIGYGLLLYDLIAHGKEIMEDAAEAVGYLVVGAQGLMTGDWSSYESWAVQNYMRKGLVYHMDANLRAVGL